MNTALAPIRVIANGDMSADITSDVVDLTMYSNVAAQLIFTGTPVGTFTIQGSVDYKKATGGTWTTLSLGAPMVAVGVADTIILDLTINIPFLRIVYTSAAGAGKLNAYVSGKVW